MRACADGLLLAAVEDDFPVFQQETQELGPYRDLDAAETDALTRIAAGRLHALGWLLGTYAWDTPLDELNYASPTSSLWAPVDEADAS